MATYVTQGQLGPLPESMALNGRDAVSYSLTSGANGVALTGSGAFLVVQADAAGWFHVSGVADDKADAGEFKSHRIPATGFYPVSGVDAGDFISFVIG